MTQDERKRLVAFCVEARAYIEDIPVSAIDAKDFHYLSDDALRKEADWLDDMLNK